LLLFNLFKELSFSKSGAKIEEKFQHPNFLQTFFSTPVSRLKNTSIKNGMQIYAYSPITQTPVASFFNISSKNLIVRPIFFKPSDQFPILVNFTIKIHYLRTIHAGNTVTRNTPFKCPIR
jgi:hypothetical protein